MKLELVSVAFNRPWLVAEQTRLVAKYLEDEHRLTVLDNSDDGRAAVEVELAALDGGAIYWRPSIEPRMHHLALNAAAASFRERGTPFYGFLDHDVFPTRPTRLLPLIEEDGFVGIGQRAPATGELYVWPGFCFFSAEWVGGRELDFGGRGGGDTGSALAPLFSEEDWEKFFRLRHGYRPIREPDEVGLQSWGVEELGDWVHLTNGSRWMVVPDPEGRERALMALLGEL